MTIVRRPVPFRELLSRRSATDRGNSTREPAGAGCQA